MTTRIDLDNHKYTYVHADDGKQYALRYGEPWRDLTGDKFVYLLAQEVIDLRAEVARLKAQQPQSS